MNRELLEGFCREVAGRIVETWGELGADALRAADGRRMQFAGRMQQRNGRRTLESARQLREFVRRHRNWRF